MKNVYLALAVIGLVVAWTLIGAYVLRYGGDLGPFFGVLFSDLGTMIAVADLSISVVVFWVFAYHESKRLHMRRWWLFIIATLGVGLSFSLPLFLYVRERRLESQTSNVNATRQTSNVGSA
jgi:hypothetical protein